ncbi:hypothetical protein THAOC_05532 [Thalassiosira oceanica]|uniref:Uncharacterized protein n=1 Tax=Thalassiosira oceanica TaxID=159749 RepID=K0T2M4_THAOC|nr:hypothetical protein THAOC_05532 [Thalassiosira oceanica]|eukprot:EJK72893.1 hypothetical protein THAOC_05532 [Thalassiosira oceanica]
MRAPTRGGGRAASLTGYELDTRVDLGHRAGQLVERACELGSVGCAEAARRRTSPEVGSLIKWLVSVMRRRARHAECATRDGAPARKGAGPPDNDVASKSGALLDLRVVHPSSGSCVLSPTLRPKGDGSMSVFPSSLCAGRSPSTAGGEASRDVRAMLRGGRAVGMQLLGTADGRNGNDPGDVEVVEAGYARWGGRWRHAVVGVDREESIRLITEGAISLCDWSTRAAPQVPPLSSKPEVNIFRYYLLSVCISSAVV